MSQPLQEILDLFVLSEVGHQTFIGPQPDDDRERVRVYGGQVAAQALAAAARTVSGRRPHSLHISFLRPGNPATPLQYEVVVLREGRSLSTRRVSASQGGIIVMEAMISFIVAIDGDEHHRPMPPVPSPETLPPFDEQLGDYLPADDDYLEMIGFRIVEMRYVDPPPRVSVDGPRPDAAECKLWLRLQEEPPVELRTDPLLAMCLLVYISDWTILDPVQIAIGKTWQQLEKMASLDHAMWLHRPVDFTDWLLYEQHCPSVNGGVGLGSGAIYNRDGTPVCTVTQEGFVGRRL